VPLASNAPTFTQTGTASVAVTWTAVTPCADGGNGTSFNYMLTMPNATTLNVVNNSNISRDYRITLTRID
jgi:hypothetical protein